MSDRPLASSYVAEGQQASSSVAGTTTHAHGTANPLSSFATDTFMRSSQTFSSPTRNSAVNPTPVPTTTYTTSGTAGYTSAVPTTYTTTSYHHSGSIPGLTGLGLAASGTYATYGTTTHGATTHGTTVDEALKRSGASGYGATGTHGGLASSGSYSYAHHAQGTVPAGSYSTYVQGAPGAYTHSYTATPSHGVDLHSVTSQSVYRPSGSFEVHAVPITSHRESEVIKRTALSSASPSRRNELRQSLLAPYRSTMYPEFELVEDLPDRRNLVDSINFLLTRSAGRESLLSSPNKVSIKRQSLLSPAEIEFENIFREKYEDGTVYEGSSRHGTRHGKGKLIYKDGRTFEGQFENGRAAGTGILRYKTGKVCYEGGFNDVHYEGQGVLQSETPIPLKGGFNYRNLDKVENHWIKYEGEFRGGKRHGRGTLHLSNGEKFVGDFRDDQISGRGQYHLVDGHVVEGQWENGVWRD